MRHLRSTAAFGAILAAAALFAGGAVKAQLTPNFDVVTPNGGNFTFSYNLDVAGAARLRAGDWFTIYDFNGYVAGSAFAPAADWTISVQPVGITPVGVTPPHDSAGVDNITFTYTGPVFDGPSSQFDGPDAFGADSTESATTAGGGFSYQNHKNNPGHPDDNARQFGAGSVVTPAGVPETSSLMLLLPGLVPLGMIVRRRIRK